MAAFDLPSEKEALKFDLGMRESGIIVGRKGTMIYIKGMQILEPLHAVHFINAIENYYNEPI